MGCQSCGHENPATNQFCGGCGAALARTCPSCRHPNPPDHRFCGACGVELHGARPDLRPPAPRVFGTHRDTPRHLADKIRQLRSSLEGERKQVTVLFADVKGSMELAEQLDPEAWSAIMRRFFTILSEGVERFEGFAGPLRVAAT